MNKKRNHRIFILYWVLLSYIVAALIWWFMALNRQNHSMTLLKLGEPGANPNTILSLEKRKTAQYIGEGAIFLLLIAAGAVYIYRSVKNRLRQTQLQEDFMMAITHELKTPIAIASLNLETLQKRKLDELRQQSIIQTALEETRRLDALCNNLLLSSRMDASGYKMVLEEIDLSSFLQKTIESYRNRFAGRSFLYACEDNILYNGDSFLLQIALNNLLDNAVKYSGKDKTVELHVFSRPGWICVEVRDYGPGISDAEKPHVFDKYYRLPGSMAKGTGLGLYLVKRVARFHKANISVTNNHPSGSIFTLELPQQNG